MEQLTSELQYLDRPEAKNPAQEPSAKVRVKTRTKGGLYDLGPTDDNNPFLRARRGIKLLVEGGSDFACLVDAVVESSLKPCPSL